MIQVWCSAVPKFDTFGWPKVTRIVIYITRRKWKGWGGKGDAKEVGLGKQSPGDEIKTTSNKINTPPTYPFLTVFRP
jgi:hypothetical protein